MEWSTIIQLYYNISSKCFSQIVKSLIKTAQITSLLVEKNDNVTRLFPVCIFMCDNTRLDKTDPAMHYEFEYIYRWIYWNIKSIL